jgi:hypothetical protein
VENSENSFLEKKDEVLERALFKKVNMDEV